MAGPLPDAAMPTSLLRRLAEEEADKLTSQWPRAGGEWEVGYREAATERL